ncbi:MAG: sensor histidine kinase [Calditrichaeota bacterium]|nr:MAG: sensor histidine kinase [Calditrichota bacterium]MBL1205445.1 sensor histidine kinase [Calditrichota bacterium]NOG45274.1 HAMP domain-containing histidine kinase [Calditrichota bacterium]
MLQFFTKNSANFKGLLFVVGLLIIGGFLWYTQQVVNVLKEKSTKELQFRIKIFESNINNPDADNDVGFFFNEVIKKADYPIIYTDTQGIPQSWLNISAKLDSISDLTKTDSLILLNTLSEIKTQNEPIPIAYQETVLGYYYYGFPPEINKIKNLPIFAIVVAIIFILFGYLGFAYIKRSEQRNIWVGMAKETAHQLGTPLTSLSGWLELINLDIKQKDNAVKEMNNDLLRLNKIANRFSKIGSVPQLKKENITQVIESVIFYYQKRLPNLNKQITISLNSDQDIFGNISRDLFEWVLENLIKNSIDSIENKNGRISVSIDNKSSTKWILISISDNGKGIAVVNKKNVFKPGFSTKKRGWGLGLSLAKRIIEEYHQGKIYLLDSQIGQGSTFRINIKKPL